MILQTCMTSEGILLKYFPKPVMYWLLKINKNIYSFIHSLIQLFIEHILYAMQCHLYYVYVIEQNRYNLYLYGIFTPTREANKAGKGDR